jgi:hypothetical protein
MFKLIFFIILAHSATGEVIVTRVDTTTYSAHYKCQEEAVAQLPVEEAKHAGRKIGFACVKEDVFK